METMLQYDNTLEKQLNARICLRDDIPFIKSKPFFAGKALYVSVDLFLEEKFRVEVHSIYDQFIKYINQFIQQNEANPEFHIHIATTLSRLITNYQNERKRITESPLRTEWKTLSKFYKIPNPKHSNKIKQNETFFRHEYDFLYKMTLIQLWFIDEVISNLVYQLQPFKNSIQDISPSKNNSLIVESKPVYFFEISKQASINSRHTLPIMYEELDAHGYIDCTLPEFKRLFFKYNQKKPTSTPIPIIWKTGHYNQLAFLIQCLSDSFLTAPKSPSNYDSATHLFCNKENGIYFTIKKKRYDYNLNLKGQEVIKSIVNRSTGSHI